MTKRDFVKMASTCDTIGYEDCIDGFTFRREAEHLSWVLRDPNGVFIAKDKYRQDMADRHNINLVERF